jgi:signal recognition particle GTPase
MYLKSLVLLRMDQAEIQKINNQINELIKEEYMNFWPSDDEYLKPALLNQQRNLFNAKMKELESTKRDIALEFIAKDISLSETEKCIEFLKKQQGLLEVFDEHCFNDIVEKIIVKSKDHLCFCLKNGMELDEYIGGADNVM